MRWRYRDTVLWICMLAFFVTFFARLVISPVVPQITAEFDVSNTAIGIGLTGMWLAYGVMQYPSGVLADRYGERTIMLLAIGGTALASVLLAASPLFPVFALMAILLGAVAGLHYTVGTTLLTDTWDDLGYAVGIHSMGAPLAGLTAPLAAAWVGVNYGWRPAVALTVTIAAPVFALLWWRIRPTPPRKPDQEVRGQFSVGLLLSVVSRPPVSFTLGLAFIGTFIIQALISFLPTFLVEHRGYSATLASVFFAGYFLSRGGLQIAIGWISDRSSRDLALVICMLSGVLGVGLLVIGPGLVSLIVAIPFLGVGASFFPAVDPRFLDQLSEAERGSEFGLVRTVYAVLGGLGPVSVGLLADVFGWPVAFATLAGLYGVASCALVTNWLFSLNL